MRHASRGCAGRTRDDRQSQISCAHRHQRGQSGCQGRPPCPPAEVQLRPCSVERCALHLLVDAGLSTIEARRSMTVLPARSGSPAGGAGTRRRRGRSRRLPSGSSRTDQQSPRQLPCRRGGVRSGRPAGRMLDRDARCAHSAGRTLAAFLRAADLAQRAVQPVAVAVGLEFVVAAVDVVDRRGWGRRVLRETDQQRDIRLPVRPRHRPLFHAVGATAREDLVGRGLHPRGRACASRRCCPNGRRREDAGWSASRRRERAPDRRVVAVRPAERSTGP